MRYSAEEIIDKMNSAGLVPVYNHAEPDTAKEVLINAHEAGIKVFEFTNRGPNALEVFKDLAKYANGHKDLILGIGTIWSLENAKKFLALGAQFVVSPGLLPEMISGLANQGILCIPGCGTITEVFTAMDSGARLVKIFPGNVLGPAFAASVKSVLPEARLMPTGGVKPTAENLSSWFRSGVHCVGMGSQLFSKNLINAGNFSELQNEISDAISLVRSVRRNL